MFHRVCITDWLWKLRKDQPETCPLFNKFEWPRWIPVELLLTCSTILCCSKFGIFYEYTYHFTVYPRMGPRLQLLHLLLLPHHSLLFIFYSAAPLVRTLENTQLSLCICAPQSPFLREAYCKQHMSTSGPMSLMIVESRNLPIAHHSALCHTCIPSPDCKIQSGDGEEVVFGFGNSLHLFKNRVSLLIQKKI